METLVPLFPGKINAMSVAILVFLFRQERQIYSNSRAGLLQFKTLKGRVYNLANFRSASSLFFPTLNKRMLIHIFGREKYMYLTRETGLCRFKIFRQTETCLTRRLNDTAAFALSRGLQSRKTEVRKRTRFPQALSTPNPINCMPKAKAQ